MKKAFAAISMLGVLMLVAAVAVAGTMNITWFVNSPPDQNRFVTWVTLKNVTASELTVTLDYYDNDDWTTIATSPTVVLAPGETTAINSANQWQDTVNNTNMGSIVVHWPLADGNEKSEVQGYVNILNNTSGYSTGVMFIYP